MTHVIDIPESWRRLWPEPVMLKGYGDGAFRFEDVRHAGGLCILPQGVFAWPRERFEEVGVEDFAPALAIAEAMSKARGGGGGFGFRDFATGTTMAGAHVDFILFGAGATHRPAPEWLIAACARLGVGLEAMTTGAAVRTYNVCRDEERLPATFLLPVS